MSAPRDLSPSQASQRWLDKQRIDKTDSTLSTYYYRVKLLVDFCEEHGIDAMGDLEPWDVDQFDTERRARGPKKVSLSKEYRTINQWLSWAESVDLVDEGVSSVLEPPETTKREEVSKERIEPAVAKANLRALRAGETPIPTASIAHTFFELMWTSGARLAALQGIDYEDVDLQDGTIAFHHRPDTDTPIKQAFNPERIIGLPDDVTEVLQAYAVQHRHKGVFDDKQRQPFLTTRQGRPGKSTLRRYSYWTSLPCHGGPCPHDRDPETCEWYRLRAASGCPSARAPHAVRTGAISNLRNEGWPLDEVAERVNTSPERIKQHYDFPSMDEQFAERRAELVDQLALNNSQDDDSTQAEENDA